MMYLALFHVHDMLSMNYVCKKQQGHHDLGRVFITAIVNKAVNLVMSLSITLQADQPTDHDAGAGTQANHL